MSVLRLSLAAALGASLASCSESLAAAPTNVLVLSIDTLRADVLGCYGSDAGHTPNLDALAERGVVFRRALAPIATTFPSHSSMFTGLYPRAHGVRWNGDSLTVGYTTLAEILDEAGFESAAFVGYGAMLTRGGLDQGFGVVSHGERTKAPKRLPGEDVNRLAFEFLDGVDPRRGTFLWLHYFEPHSPYMPTDWARERLAGYEGPLADGASKDEMHALNDQEQPAEADLAALETLYAGSVRYADELVGELLEGLEELGRLDDTILVVVGDHGQSLGEHGHVGHGSLLWQEVLDVPFLIVDPRSSVSGDVETRVGVVDLTPTVLDLLGLDSPGEIQGRSLAPAIFGEPLEDELYFAEVRVANPRQQRPRGQWDAVAVFHEQHKFVLQGDDEMLYDLGTDPGEQAALAPELEPELVERLRPLARFHEALSPEAMREGPELTEAVEAELRALGYLGDDDGSE